MAIQNKAVITAVHAVGMTVLDVDRSIDFYSRVLPFEMLSDVELSGQEFNHYLGVPGLRARLLRMKSGAEVLELTGYHTPKGRPIPSDSKSNDEWFQHIAVIVSNMQAAHSRMREYNVKQVSAGPQLLPE